MVMRTKIFTLSVLLSLFGLAHAQLEVLKIPAGKEPVIDGIMDEYDPWTEDAWIEMLMEVSSSTTSEASSKFQILHNGETIYIIQKIVDPTPNNDATVITNTYARDCNEIFFHMDNNPGGGSYTGSTSQLRFQRDGDGSTGFDGTAAIVSALKADSRFEWMVTTDDDGWIFEGAFPIDALDLDGFFDGSDFMFEIKATDNSNGKADGRTQQLYWNDGADNQWQNVASFGEAYLSQTEISITNSIKQSNILNSAVYFENDRLVFRNIEGAVRIYSISGSIVKNDVIDSNGSIEVSTLKSGVYIVKANGLSSKFTKY